MLYVCIEEKNAQLNLDFAVFFLLKFLSLSLTQIYKLSPRRILIFYLEENLFIVTPVIS